MGTPIGRILLMPRGDYSVSAVYNSLDWVRHSGSAWVCTTDNTTGVTPAAGVPEWQLMASDGSVGGWSSLAGKPFETLGKGMKKDTDDSLTIKIGNNLLLGSVLDVAVKNTYIGTGTSSDRPISGQGVADAIEQVYDGTSSKAQSGTAVAGALSETVNKVSRTLASVAVGAEIRIPETGTDSKLSTANTADKLIIAYSDKGDFPIISNTLSDGYTTIKVAKAETNITLGVAIIKL